MNDEEDKLGLFYIALYKDKEKFLEELDRMLARRYISGYTIGYNDGRYLDACQVLKQNI